MDLHQAHSEVKQFLKEHYIITWDNTVSLIDSKFSYSYFGNVPAWCVNDFDKTIPLLASE